VDLVLGRYGVQRRLAVGGMGEVFLAVQHGAAGVRRPVILKTLLPDLAADPAFVQQFLDEARVVARLNHPNVVSLLEVETWQGQPVIVIRGLTWTAPNAPVSDLVRPPEEDLFQ
jgi:serine/threonine protein kinase